MSCLSDIALPIELFATTVYRGNFDDLDTAIEVYVKNTKEKIHELANKYKSQITEEVYNRLMNYPNK